MKKIITGLVFVAYILSFLMFIKYFETNEMIGIQEKMKTPLVVSEWNKDETQKDKLKKINKVAKDEKVNIYKIVYKPVENSQKQKIIIYTALGNMGDFKKEFSLKWGNFIFDQDTTEQFLSSIETNDSRQLGRIDLFTPSIVVEIRPIEAAINENIRGTYLINSKDSKVVARIKESFTSDLGFEIQNQQQDNEIKTIAESVLNKYVLTVIAIVFTLICLSFLYYILLKYKELAIKKMFGFTNRELIFKVLVKDNIKIHSSALVIAIIVQGIYLYFYNGGSKFVCFEKQLIIMQIILMGVSLIIGLIPFLMVYHIEISKMLKNKKPMKLIQFLNYSSKFLFSAFLLIMIVNLTNNFQEFTAQNSNKDKWETTKEYSFYEYQGNYVGSDRKTWEYEIGLKSKKLFELAEKKGGILIKPSDGIQFKEFIEKNDNKDSNTSVPQYDPEGGNVLEVNAQYINSNPVYDMEGKKITLDKDYGDYLIVLVPNKYRGKEKEILNTYKKWYQFKRFIDEDIHNESIGKAAENHKDVEVKIRYIQDGNKHFLYNPNIEVKNKNYAKDSLLVIINSQNIGGDSYLNYMTGKYFFPHIDNVENPYNDLKQDIQLVGLENLIMTTPLLYSTVDEYLYNLKNQIILYMFLALVLIITEVVIVVFMVLNYLEKNKFMHSVKKIHGFSFYKRHKKFIGITTLFWLVIYLGAILSKMSDLRTILYYLVATLAAEFVLIYLIIKFTESKKTKDVLKGA